MPHYLPGTVVYPRFSLGLNLAGVSSSQIRRVRWLLWSQRVLIYHDILIPTQLILMGSIPFFLYVHQKCQSIDEHAITQSIASFVPKVIQNSTPQFIICTAATQHHPKTKTQPTYKLAAIVNMTKFLKIAVGGVAVAAIAVGIGVGVGVHQKTKRNETAAANSAINDPCRRLLVVPGVEESFTYEAPSIRRKLLARSLGATLATPAPSPQPSNNFVETFENAWGGDGHHNQVNPVKPSTVSKGSISKGAYYTPSNVSKVSKGTASTASVSKVSKGSVSKVSKGTTNVTDSKGSKNTKAANVTDSKGSKGSKGTKTANVTDSKGNKKGSKIPVRIPRIFV